MDIVDQLIAVRKQRGISQQKLAQMSGIFQPVIARIETKKSSPTVEFLQKVLDVLDLKMTLVDAFESPSEIKRLIKGLPHRRVDVGRSGDKVYVFGEKYLLKISDDKESLRLEESKTDWVSERVGGPKSIKYIEDDCQSYYLRTYAGGHTLIEDRYLTDPRRLIGILKNVVGILRSLDDSRCPFESMSSKGTDFVHGDFCLPNIVVDDEDSFVGFLDLADSGLGDKQCDYCWLLWSFEYNLKTNRYNAELLRELGIEVDSNDYLHYVLSKIESEGLKKRTKKKRSAQSDRHTDLFSKL